MATPTHTKKDEPRPRETEPQEEEFTTTMTGRPAEKPKKVGSKEPRENTRLFQLGNDPNDKVYLTKKEAEEEGKFWVDEPKQKQEEDKDNKTKK